MQPGVDVRSPFDGALLGTVAVTTPHEADQAIERAYALFRDRGGWLPLQRRVDILATAGTLILERRNDLAMIVARESGKPLRDALVEIDRAAASLEICIRVLQTDAGEVVPMGLNAISAAHVAFTQHEPVGVVLGISAFNHPFNLVAHQVAPAIAVGAPVLIKPSPKTPLSCRAFCDIMAEAGLPDGWLQMLLPVEVEDIARIVGDRRIGFLTFIGSAAVGWTLRARLAPGARCALEHGGIAPVIVAGDADLADAVPRIARAGFWHAGQACVSIQRVFCARQVLDDFLARLESEAHALVTGDPCLMTTDVGPLISRAELERVDGWVAEAVSGGARLVAGGKAISQSCYRNTVVLGPSPDAKLSRREVFGPVIAVYPYEDIDQAIAQANDGDFAFQSAVFTGDLDRAMHAFRNLDGTAVMVNETPLFRVDWMPFAGARQSGLGTGGIPHTMRDMRTEKMMVLRSPSLGSKPAHVRK